MLKRSLVCHAYRHISRACVSYRNTSNGPSANPPDPPSPELCCRSGCANCVYIEYVKELKDYYKEDGSIQANIDEALKNIEDPSFRMFIKMEIEASMTKK